MPRPLVAFLGLFLILSLAACVGLNAIGPTDITGKPSVYAVVDKAPNPLLVGCYMRSTPSEFNRPNRYEFCLVKDGDKYALYYYMMDGKTLARTRGWTSAVVNGDTFTSGADGVRYFVKDGAVWQDTGSYGPHKMLKTF